jgi:uncharacterized protein
MLPPRPGPTMKPKRSRPMLMRLFRSLMPREEKFMDYFCDHSLRIVGAADALRAMMEGGDAVASHFRTVCEKEGEADMITKNTLQAIHRTFITPFDRTDIHALITAMDDTVDLIEETAQRIMLYDIHVFTPEMKKMADTARTCARLLQDGLPLLRDINGNVGELDAMGREIGRIEGEADATLRHGIKLLMQTERDPVCLMTRKEIYELLEQVIDRCEDVVNVVEGIVIEQV